MPSFTISLSGNSSELWSPIYPEILLDDQQSYSCGLLDFTTYQSIPNVTAKNNEISTYRDTDGDVSKAEANQIAILPDGTKKKRINTIQIPEGTYEAVDLLKTIKSMLEKKNTKFEYEINKNTLKATIKCSDHIVCPPGATSPLELLGFKNGFYIPKNTITESAGVIKISNVNVIRIESNITSGAYVNGKLCHSIYEFSSQKVDTGYKIIEQPRNIIYLPVVPRRINFIQLSIVDQNGDLVDFRGETVTCRIHIKSDND